MTGRLEWDEFRLSEQEQIEVCDKFFRQVEAADPTDDKRLKWLERMLPVLRRDTAGHAGLLTLAARQLWDESWDKGLSNLPADEFTVALDRHYPDAIFRSRVAVRVGLVANSLPPDDVTRKVMQEVLANKVVAAPPQERCKDESAEVRAKRALMRAVILVPVTVARGSRVLQFATPMHARFWLGEVYPGSSTHLPSGISSSSAPEAALDRTC